MAQVSFKTHKGKAVYPWLNKADTEFNEDGVYKTGLRVPADQAKELVDLCKEVAIDELGAKKAATAHMPFKTDAETGELIINVKSKYKPIFWTADAKRIPEDKEPEINSGAVIKAGGFITAYDRNGNHGISLRLKKIQVIEVVERDENDSGFAVVEEGGYTMAPESANDDKEEEGFSADF